MTIVSPLHELLADGALFKRLTVEQYDRMLRDGILEEGEPYELLDGQVLFKDRTKAGDDPTTVGDEHILVVQAFVEINPKLKRLGCHVRVQQPVDLPPHDQPEPDAAIVRGDRLRYAGRKPRADDIACVVEVADASLGRDRTGKMRIYAAGRVPVYVIVNLPDRQVEVYTRPVKGRYAHSETLTRGQILSVPVAKGKSLAIPVKELLPPVA